MSKKCGKKKDINKGGRPKGSFKNPNKIVKINYKDWTLRER